MEPCDLLTTCREQVPELEWKGDAEQAWALVMGGCVTVFDDGEVNADIGCRQPFRWAEDDKPIRACLLEMAREVAASQPDTHEHEGGRRLLALLEGEDG